MSGRLASQLLILYKVLGEMMRLKTSLVSTSSVTVAVAIWIALFGNLSFFSHVLAAYPLSLSNAGFVTSQFILVAALTVLLLAPFAVGRAFKPLLIVMLLISAMAAYFMDSYNVVISSEVIESALHTDASESMGLLSAKLFAYLGLLGILPAVAILLLRVPRQTVGRAFIARLKLMGTSLAVITVALSMFNSAYASFFREHKSIRFYTNPATPVYTAVRYAFSHLNSDETLPYQQIGLDARQGPAHGKRRLVVLVVGETARADHFSLNGYPRETNPLLAKRHVTSFDNVWSCGTATSVSVPCMFSLLEQGNYSERVARRTDNALDIIQRAGVHVAWLDNNSDSKGVALRIPYTSYRSEDTNAHCDTECRDDGMLAGVREFVSAQDSGDVLVVLHQMGSHGPEYYKRYPRSFAVFSPSCQSNLLEDCSQAEISNAYDNSIRYTDYFLSQVIDYLSEESGEFATAMLYLSDHGESLGESGIYLHGFPYALAPEVQKHVPMIFWSDTEFSKVKNKLAKGNFVHQRFSQDNLFHTLLGLMDVRTGVYKPALDMFANG